MQDVHEVRDIGHFYPHAELLVRHHIIKWLVHMILQGERHHIIKWLVHMILQG